MCVGVEKAFVSLTVILRFSLVLNVAILAPALYVQITLASGFRNRWKAGGGVEICDLGSAIGVVLPKHVPGRVRRRWVGPPGGSKLHLDVSGSSDTTHARHV